MEVSSFDFELPEACIALRPSAPRDAARMLVVDGNAQNAEFSDEGIKDIPGHLRPGDVLVFNDTKVIPARLRGRRPADDVRGEAGVEVTLHMREGGGRWRAFVRPAKRLRVGDTVVFDGSLSAEVTEKGEGGEVVFHFNKAAQEFDKAIEVSGIIPLPPYIAGKRETDARDRADYQTIYASEPGAVAAPTAGLHFTDGLLRALDDAGIKRVTLTLHVGAGTFLPVSADDTTDHKMHAEYGVISLEAAAAINLARAAGGRVVAVGTTSLRLLESAADEDGTIHPFSGETDIFITPGYRFKAVDILLTNFHLPRSTLFMLVSAFSGLEVMQGAYAHAIEAGYRFYSYGDACLLTR